MQKQTHQKNPSKLQDFLQKHRSQLSQFESANSTQQKFHAFRNAIMICNGHPIEPIQGIIHGRGKGMTTVEGEQESQENYLRQLNKMCQGQELFQQGRLDGLNQIKMTKKNKKFKYRMEFNKKQVLSVHDIYKYDQNKKKEKQNQNQKTKKFLQVPNFASILEGCSAGYVRVSAQTAMRRKIKRFKQNIMTANLQAKGRPLTTVSHAKRNRNQKLKQQIYELKQKAMNEYDLNFDDDHFGDPQEKIELLKEKTTSQYIDFQSLQLKNQQQLENRLKEHKNFFKKPVDKKEQAQNFAVPRQLLHCRVNSRPITVGCNILRSKKLRNSHIKNNYFRI